METEEKVERGSGNVFADLGHPEAEVHLLKAELVTRIDRIIRRRKLKQADAAKLLGLSQPDVSRLLRGCQFSRLLSGTALASLDGTGAGCGNCHSRTPFKTTRQT